MPVSLVLVDIPAFGIFCFPPAIVPCSPISTLARGVVGWLCWPRGRGGETSSAADKENGINLATAIGLGCILVFPLPYPPPPRLADDDKQRHAVAVSGGRNGGLDGTHEGQSDRHVDRQCTKMLISFPPTHDPRYLIKHVTLARRVLIAERSGYAGVGMHFLQSRGGLARRESASGNQGIKPVKALGHTRANRGLP